MAQQPKRYATRPVNTYLSDPAVQQACAVLPLCSIGLRSTVLTVFTQSFPDMPPRIRRPQQSMLLAAPEGGVGEWTDMSFTPHDREAATTLMTAAGALPQERVTERILDEAVRYLRHVYGPTFNDDPTATITTIMALRDTANPTARRIYERLVTHYQETLQLQDLLETYINQP